MTDWLNSENGIEKQEADKRLTEGWINIALYTGNRVLGKWIKFNRDLNNILTLMNSKMLGLDAVNLIIGDDLLAVRLREIFISGKDFQIPQNLNMLP